MAAVSLLAATALPVFAQTATTAPATAPSPRRTVDVACIQSAIEKRDTTIATAVNAHAVVQTTAIAARKAALKAAWALTDQKARRAALRDAWKAFTVTSKAARKAFRDSQRTAWKQFNTDRKTCGSGVSDDPGNEGHDSQL